ncbi:DUF4381 domain-containing protein [Vibrio astriarenae]|uniref:DUF4381 domain-containing protein n=1 Tax=Vibrio astriarenae TaxID=1481923 RepID=UPI00373593E1
MQQQADTLPLKGLHLPDAPSWFPLSMAWWLTLFTIIVLSMLTFWLLKRRRTQHAPKRTALKLITQQQTPSQAMEVVRQVAFSYYSRQEFAALTGSAWYDFLDAELGSDRFKPKSELWQSALYMSNEKVEELDYITDCEYWIRHALPPKRRGGKSE